MQSAILRIAIPTPLYRLFDYLPPRDVDCATLQPGQRVRVPFGRRNITGVLIDVADDTDITADKLKRAQAVIDSGPLLPHDILAMVQWASRYYHCPIGEAVATALPVLLRRGMAPAAVTAHVWRLTATGRQIRPEQLARAPRQAALIETLRAQPDGLARAELQTSVAILRAVQDKGLIERVERVPAVPEAARQPAHTLNPHQQAAVDQVLAGIADYRCWLLEGVTGSGKTEVYLTLIEQLLHAGKQALVLVPEIGLTPQLLNRFRQRLPATLAVMHSGLGERERLLAWQQARSGEAQVIIGTRSAVFTPLAQPGLIVVDEEHDASLKQQDGFRYSARDLAVWRARHLGIPVLLGSATPSLESLHNMELGRYHHLVLPERTGRAVLPAWHVLDVRHQKLQHGLSPVLLSAVHRHLAADNQVLLFLNRRGYAPTLMCYECDWQAECRRCDARMTWHHSDGLLHCHHCGSQRPVETRCPSCGSAELHPQGQGTERVEEALAEQFPDVERLRIDRDTTRRRGSLDALLARAAQGRRQLLLGTQMLAKGHHFPNVTLVGILDADHGLFSTDFRASERMAQMIVQVAGRAGRQDRRGEVIIQTCHPAHPLLQLLVTQGYPAFARAALAERMAARFPPFSHLALLRAEAPGAGLPVGFLEHVRARLQQQGKQDIEVWGPVPAGMERRAGRYRAQLWLQSDQRGALQQVLESLTGQLEQERSSRRVRWSIDVDPADTY